MGTSCSVETPHTGRDDGNNPAATSRPESRNLAASSQSISPKTSNKDAAEFIHPGPLITPSSPYFENVLKDNSVEFLRLLGPLANTYGGVNATTSNPVKCAEAASAALEVCSRYCDPTSGYLGNIVHVIAFLDRGLIAKILLNVPGMDERIFGAPAVTHGNVSPLHIAVAERNVRFLSALVQHFSPCVVDAAARRNVVNVYKPQFSMSKVDGSQNALQEMYAALASDLMINALDATDEELDKRRKIIVALLDCKSDSGHTPFQMHTEASQARTKTRKRSGKEKSPDDQRDEAVLLCLSFLQSAAVGRHIVLKPQADGQVCYGPPSIKSIGSILRSTDFLPMDIEYYIAKDMYFNTRRILIPEANDPEPDQTTNTRFASIPLFGDNSLSRDSPGVSGELDNAGPENGCGSRCSRPVVIVGTDNQQQDNSNNNMAAEDENADSKLKSSFARKVARRRSSMHYLEATIESLSNSALRSKTDDALLASFSLRQQQAKVTYTAAPLPAAILFDNFTAFKYFLSDGRAKQMLEGSDSKGNSVIHVAAYRQTELKDSRYLDYLQNHVPESKNLIYRTNDASLRPGQVRVIPSGNNTTMESSRSLSPSHLPSGLESPPIGATEKGAGSTKSNLIDAINPDGITSDVCSASTTSTIATLRPFASHFHVRPDDAVVEQGSGEIPHFGSMSADPIVITSSELTADQRAFLALEDTPDELQSATM